MLMTYKKVGILIGSRYAQASVNTSHGRDIGFALEACGYVVRYYDLADRKSLEKLMVDGREGLIDIVFNNGAGKLGGDGSVEGLLELAGIPYVGSNSVSTALAFDKRATKEIAKSIGILVADSISVYADTADTALEQLVAENIAFPVVVKASRGSDSIGVSLVKNEEELYPAIQRALLEDDEVISAQMTKGWEYSDLLNVLIQSVELRINGGK